jgi:flagellar protein FliL
MRPISVFARLFSGLLLLALLLPVPVAFANDHGGGAAGPEPFKFIVNLGTPSRGGKYLQVEMVFEGATPEVAHLVTGHRPQIQHALILMLSGEDSAKLLTLQGKRDLMENIVEIVNHVLHEDEKTGVKEVLFTSFIIQ